MSDRIGGRNTNLDVVKGLSAYLVIIIHYSFPIGSEYATAIARIAVPLFFMISGYFCKGEWGEIKRKIVYQLKIYIVGELIYLIHYGYYNYALGTEGEWLRSFVNIKTIFDALVYGESKLFIGGWFLLALCQVYLLFFIIKKYNLYKLACIFIPLLIVWNWLCPRVLTFINVDVFHLVDLKVLRATPFFMLGNLWKKKEDEVRSLFSKGGMYIFIALGVIAIFVEKNYLDKMGIQKDWFIYIGTILVIIGCFAWALYCPQVKKSILAYVGKNLSMYIYVLHILVIREINIRIGYPEIDWIWIATTVVAFILYQFQKLVKRFIIQRKIYT